MKKIIGIVARPTISESKRRMLGVYESYIRCIIRAGGIPLIISPTQDIEYIKDNSYTPLTIDEESDLKVILDLCDGFLLPGGSDIYEYDYNILEYAIKNNKPVLGICLGMQIMATYKGTNLVLAYNHNQVNHEVNISEDSALYEIFKRKKLIVNSRHKEQVKDSGLYKVIAKGNEGVIEGIELDGDTFNLGVQWHPEDLDEQVLFDYFLEQIKKQ